MKERTDTHIRRHIPVPAIVRKVWIGTPSALCLAAVLWLTLSPSPTGDASLPAFPGADKIVHAVMFGGLTLLFCFDLWRFRDGKYYFLPLSPFLCAVLTTLIGVGIEYLQETMALGRSFELTDMAADGAGAFAVAALATAFPFRNH